MCKEKLKWNFNKSEWLFWVQVGDFNPQIEFSIKKIGDLYTLRWRDCAITSFKYLKSAKQVAALIHLG